MVISLEVEKLIFSKMGYRGSKSPGGGGTFPYYRAKLIERQIPGVKEQRADGSSDKLILYGVL